MHTGHSGRAEVGLGVEMKRELYMNETEVRRFAEQAIFKITPEKQGVSCVDGRYPEHSATGTAMAGGSAGLLESGLAAANELHRQFGTTVTNEQILQAVFATVGGKEKFSYHSDTEHGLDGCGHTARCVSRGEEYGLNSEQTTFIAQTLRALQADGIKPVELTGAHAEEAVIVIKLPEYNPNAIENLYSMEHQVDIDGKRTQAFIYTETLVNNLLQKLAENISRALPSDTTATTADILSLIQKAEAKQRSITVQELALDKGKPVYEISINPEGNISSLNKIG